MADAESRINLNIDADQAIATIKNLQAQISTFHQSLLSSGNAANAAISQNLQRNLVNSINATRNFSASLQTVKSSAESFTESLERNKLSMGQYFKYGMASTKTFGRSFKNELATIDKVARERVKTLQTQYIKLGRDANGAIQTIAVRPLKLDMQNLATQMQMNIQKQQIFNQLLRQGSTNLLNFGKNTQWAGRQLMVGFTIPLSIMGGAAIKAFQAMEEEVIRFKRVYGELNTTISETENMAKSIQGLANEFTKYGIAVEKTMGLAADAAAMGKMGVDLLDQVTEATRLAVLGGVEQQDALETTISLTNAFGIATEQLAGSIDFLNSVENQTVVSIEDLTTAIPKAGPVVQQLGGDVKDLAFFLTAMKEGGINASEGANALKSGLASLINPTKQSSDMLAGFGINVKGIVEANKGDLKGTIISFANALDQLDPLNRAQAIEQLFGKFQFARISTLFQNVIAEGSQASRVLELSRASAEELAILSERELKRVEDSPAYKFQKSIEDIKTQLIPLGQEFIKLITPIIEFGSAILKQFNNLDDGLKTFITGAIGVLGLLAPVALMTIGLFANGIANLIKGFGLLKNFMLMISGASSGVSASTEYMTQQQLEAAAVAASLSQSHATLTQVFSSEASALYNLIGAYQAATAAQSSYNASSAVSRTGRNTGLVDPSGNPLKLASGIFSVPGPKGAGDIVPAMLSPGEAVIPADKAQKYGGLIKGIIAGDIPGFQDGLFKKDFAHITPGRQVKASDLLASDVTSLPQHVIKALQELARVLPEAVVNLKHSWGAAMSKETNIKLGKLSGAAPEAVAAEFDGDTSKYAEVGALTGTDMADPQLQKELQEYDRVMSQKIREAKERGIQRIVDNDAMLEEMLPDERAKSVSLESLDRETIAEIGPANKKLVKLREDAQATIRDVRIGEGLTREDKQAILADPEASKVLSRRISSKGEARRVWKSTQTSKIGGFGKMDVSSENLPTIDATEDANEYSNALATELESRSQDPYMYVRDRNSPHPLSGPDGADDARSYQQNFEANLGTGANGVGGPALPGPPPIPGFEQSPASQIADSVDTPAAKRDLKGAASSIIGNLASGIKDKGKAKAKELGEKALMPLAKIVSKGTGNILVSEYQKENIEYDSDTGVTTNAQTGEVISTEAPGSVPMAYDKDGNAILNPDGTPMTGEAYKKLEKQAKAQKRVTRAGKVAGAAGFIAMGAGMAGGMIGGEVGNFMTTVVAPVAGAVAMIAPILLSLSAPVAIAVAALGLLVGGFILYNNELKKVREEARKLGESLGSGAKAMERFSDFAGTVGPTEIMSRRRSGMGNQITEVLGKTEFGKNFVGSEQGKELLDSIEKGINQLGRSQTINSIARQLTTAVATNVLTQEQAEQIALHLGDQMNDFSISTNLIGQMNEFFGPNGEKLSDGEPLKIFFDLSAQSIEGFQSNVLEAFKGLNDKGGWFDALGLGEEQIISFTAGSLGAFFEEQQAAIDGFLVSQDKVIENTVAEAKALQEKGKIEEANAKFAEVDKLRAERASGLVQIQNQYSDAIRQSLALLEGADDNSRYSGMTRDEIIQDLRDSGVDPMDAAGQADMILQDIVEIDNFATRTLDSLGQGVIDKFSEADDITKALISGAVNGIKQLDGLDVTSKIVLTSAVGSGALSPAQIGSLLDTFKDGDDAQKYLKIVADVGVEFGQGATQQIGNIVELIGSRLEDDIEKKDVTANLLDFVNDKSKNEKDFNMIMDMLSTMSSYIDLMGGPDTLINFIGLDDKSIKNMIGKLKGMQDLIDRSVEPITVETLIEQKIITDATAIQAFKNNQKYFDELDPVQQYLYVQTFLSVIGSVSTEQAIAELEAEGAQKSGGINRRKFGKTAGSFTPEQISNKIAEIANRIAESVTNTSKAVSNLGDTIDEEGKGGGTTEDPFAFILKDLQNLRDAAINAQGGVAELMRLFEGTNDITIFDGIDQQLTRLGFNADFVNYLTGLDKEMQDLFFTVSNGKVVFTETGIAMKDAFDQKILGAFQATQVRTITDIKNQNSALVKLTEAGIELAQAYELVQDAALAAAIANGKMSDDEWKDLVDSINEATEATKRFAAAQNLVNSNAEFGDLQEINQWILDNQDILSGELINEILNNSALQQFILAGPDLSQEERDVLEEFLQNFLNQEADLSLDVKKLTIEGMEEIFNDGFNKAMEAFAAEEKAIELEFEMRLADDNKLVTDAENQIAAINFEIDDLEAQLVGIEEQEEKINEAYDDKLKALEEIKSANEDIARQAKSQLTIADALSRGDISAAAAAAQELRSQNAQARIENQQKLLEKSRELELARITAANGKTRKQIEDEIKKLKDEIFQIEENTLEPAQERIRLAEIEKQQRIDAITVLGKTKLEWELIKNGIDLAKTRSDIYADAMQAALDIVKDIEDYWNGLNRTVTTVHQIIERVTRDTPPPTPEPTPEPEVGDGGGSDSGTGGGTPAKTINPAWKALDDKIKNGNNDIERYKGLIADVDKKIASLTSQINALKNVSGMATVVEALRQDLNTQQYTKNQLGQSIGIVERQIAEWTTQRNKEPQYLASGGIAKGYRMGGLLPYKAEGGSIFKSLGTDTIPAMLSPGEFVVRKFAVDNFGVDRLKAINSGTYSGESVYNYSVNVNVKSDANPDQIARAVMTQIKQIDSQRIRSNRF